jgi:putative NADPH-quinone reductase
MFYFFVLYVTSYFDRVLLPGVAFKTDNINTRPVLSHITKIGVVATYHQSWWTTFLSRDMGRKWISKALRNFFAMDCTLQWHGVYCVDNSLTADEKDRMPDYINETKEMFKHF